jgi:hypothetical protein
MSNEERNKAIASLKEICQEIGCSGLSPELCQTKPHYCTIIRKLVKPYNTSVHADCDTTGVP